MLEVLGTLAFLSLALNSVFGNFLSVFFLLKFPSLLWEKIIVWQILEVWYVDIAFSIVGAIMPTSRWSILLYNHHNFGLLIFGFGFKKGIQWLDLSCLISTLLKNCIFSLVGKLISATRFPTQLSHDCSIVTILWHILWQIKFCHD